MVLTKLGLRRGEDVHAHAAAFSHLARIVFCFTSRAKTVAQIDFKHY